MTWYGLVVMTVVFESIDSGSNPDTTFSCGSPTRFFKHSSRLYY